MSIPVSAEVEDGTDCDLQYVVSCAKFAYIERGFVRIGYNGLAVSIGQAGNSDYPEVRCLAEKVEFAARDHGVPLSGMVTDPDTITESLKEGYRLITLGNDLSGLC